MINIQKLTALSLVFMSKKEEFPFYDGSYEPHALSGHKFQKPITKPQRPNFSSGPCVKYDGFDPSHFLDAPLGRSHRCQKGLDLLSDVIKSTRHVLEIPDDYHVAIVPGSATGAMESAIWNLLGPRPVTVLSHDVFSYRWQVDVEKMLPQEDVDCRLVQHGHLPSKDNIEPTNDLLFNLNGSTSGVIFNDHTFLKDRTSNPDRGIVVCDITSAAFTTKIPWAYLDAVGFSWQKGLGGEAAHGILVLSPDAVKRIESYMPSWPIPYIFKLRKKENFYAPLFHEKTLNTPSLLCAYDFKKALEWAHSLENHYESSLSGLIKRTDDNFKIIKSYCEKDPYLSLFCKDLFQQSHSTVVLDVSHPQFNRLSEEDKYQALKSIALRVEQEQAGFEILNHPSAPPTLRIWCGPTVNAQDIEALLPWVSWSISEEF